ncbi:MAG: hypothetical protein GY713_01730 [Actinomycetia bacterium]|nr:hypothetical protein [Actinomycetes bacterium]
MSRPRIPGYRLGPAQPDLGPGDCYEAVAVAGEGDLEGSTAVRVRVVTDLHPTVEFDRLIRELEIGARLGRTSRIGTTDGALWVVYPQGGPTLADLMPGSRVAVTAHRDAALAAGEMHQMGTVHRAISPAAITWDGTTGRLTDLGRTRWTGGSSPTGDTGPIGTMTCMAPELLTGGRATPASDVWSLAASLHLCLTGVGAYGELPTGLVAALRTATGRRPRVHRDMPEPLRLLLSRELSADPSRRSPSGTRLAELLETRRILR